ncbi:MAG: hypothetical protein AB7I41_07760, partial [Candidatus Sericytochromatia bacterium]
REILFFGQSANIGNVIGGLVFLFYHFLPGRPSNGLFLFGSLFGLGFYLSWNGTCKPTSKVQMHIGSVSWTSRFFLRDYCRHSTGRTIQNAHRWSSP